MCGGRNYPTLVYVQGGGRCAPITWRYTHKWPWTYGDAFAPCKEWCHLSVFTMPALTSAWYKIAKKLPNRTIPDESQFLRNTVCQKFSFVLNVIKIYLTIVFVAQMLKRVDAVFSVWLPVCIVVIGIIIVTTRKCRKWFYILRCSSNLLHFIIQIIKIATN